MIEKKEKLTYHQWTKNQTTTIFEELYLLDSLGVIGEIGVEKISLIYSHKFGERIVPQNIVDLNSTQVAILLSGMYIGKWERIQKVVSDLLEFDGYDSEILVDEIHLNTNIKNILNNNINNVTAYDSDDLSIDDSSDSNISESDEQDRNRKYSRKTRNIVNVDIRNGIIENSNIVTNVCTDVAEVMGLKIY